MKVTFPDIGYAGLAAGILFRDLGVDYVPTPSPEGAEEREAFRDAPEDMCMPFKLFLAELDEAWRRGADTVIMPSSRGPCRLGEFCELLRVILERRGCHYRWIVLDVPSDIGFRELLRRASSILPEKWKKKRNVGRLLGKLHNTYHLLKQMESFEAELRRNAGYYDEPKVANELISSCAAELSEAADLEEAFDVMGRYRWKKARLTPNFSHSPVKIAITGEIFTLNEPYANRRIEDRLTELGVCLEKDITLTWWMKKIVGNPLRRFSPAERLRGRGGREKPGGGKELSEKLFGRSYLGCEIGGYTKDSVAYAASGRLRGFDGVIQIFPAGCMPEIVGRSILNRVSEAEDIRIMTLIYDEMSGEAGYLTRIEAFADMLERRKKNETEENRATGKNRKAEENR